MIYYKKYALIYSSFKTNSPQFPKVYSSHVFFTLEQRLPQLSRALNCAVPACHNRSFSNPHLHFGSLNYNQILNSFLFTCSRNKPRGDFRKCQMIFIHDIALFYCTDARFQNHFYCTPPVNFVYP